MFEDYWDFCVFVCSVLALENKKYCVNVEI